MNAKGAIVSIHPMPNVTEATIGVQGSPEEDKGKEAARRKNAVHAMGTSIDGPGGRSLCLRHDVHESEAGSIAQ